MITHTYGVYLSNTIDKALLLDLLLPPKKCPLDCVICPLGATSHFSVEGLKPPPPPKLLEDAKSNGPQDTVLQETLVWGFGDPLLLEDLDVVLKGLKEAGIARIYVHTSGLRAKQVEKILGVADRVLIPYLWYGEEKHALGWAPDKSFSAFLELLRELVSKSSGKIQLELYVFRLGISTYPSLEHLDEAIARLAAIRIEEIVVKPVERPSPGRNIKPPAPRYVDALAEELENRGFNTRIEHAKLPNSPFKWRRVVVSLYNHILRIPLSTDEIRAYYGNLGVIALNNLVSEKKVARVSWGKKLFYKGI